ncbi:hypothetical protein TorRG33x02_334560, partial [Trema orientale]
MDEGNIKINVDTSVSNSTVAVGIVARNYKGEIIVINVFRGPCDSIESAEAFAMFKSLELIATNKCWPNVIFEGDSMNVIDAFGGDFDVITWEACVYIDDAAKILLPKLHSSFFSWTSRRSIE